MNVNVSPPPPPPPFTPPLHSALLSELSPFITSSYIIKRPFPPPPPNPSPQGFKNSLSQQSTRSLILSYLSILILFIYPSIITSSIDRSRDTNGTGSDMRAWSVYIYIFFNVFFFIFFWGGSGEIRRICLYIYIYTVCRGRLATLRPTLLIYLLYVRTYQVRLG